MVNKEIDFLFGVLGIFMQFMKVYVIIVCFCVQIFGILFESYYVFYVISRVYFYDIYKYYVICFYIFYRQSLINNLKYRCLYCYI